MSVCRCVGGGGLIEALSVIPLSSGPCPCAPGPCPWPLAPWQLAETADTLFPSSSLIP